MKDTLIFLVVFFLHMFFSGFLDGSGRPKIGGHATISAAEDTEQALEELEQKFAVLRKTREAGGVFFVGSFKG